MHAGGSTSKPASGPGWPCRLHARIGFLSFVSPFPVQSGGQPSTSAVMANFSMMGGHGPSAAGAAASGAFNPNQGLTLEEKLRLLKQIQQVSGYWGPWVTLPLTLN